MVKVTRLNGVQFHINPHQIECIQATPDTVVTLINGQKYIVKENVDELLGLIVKYRRSVAPTCLPPGNDAD
ncbi:MAG: flagellar FlbD family protein [bacterium]